MPTIQIIWTVVAFAVFVGIIVWAYSAHRKRDFDEAAQLPLADDMPLEDLHSGEKNNV